MKKRKKIIAIWAAALLFTVALFIAVRAIVSSHDDEEAEPVERTNAYAYFYEPQWGVAPEDRDDYEDWAGYDRSVMVRDGAVSDGMTDENETSFREEVRFFRKYFEAIAAGDADAYDRLFTTSYGASHGRTPAFTPPPIYEQEIERVKTEHAGANSYYTFNVYYKIYHNDGTFRKDIYSDRSRGIQIVVDDTKGELRISSLKYFT